MENGFCLYNKIKVRIRWQKCWFHDSPVYVTGKVPEFGWFKGMVQRCLLGSVWKNICEIFSAVKTTTVTGFLRHLNFYSISRAFGWIYKLHKKIFPGDFQRFFRIQLKTTVIRPLVRNFFLNTGAFIYFYSIVNLRIFIHISELLQGLFNQRYI